MQAFRVAIGEIGIGALDPPRDIGRREQIKDPIDAIRGYAAFLGIGDGFGDVIGRSRSIKPRQRIEHGRAHLGPLLARLFEGGFCGVSERLALI